MNTAEKTAEQPQIHSNAGEMGDGRLSAPSAMRNMEPITEALKSFVPTIGRALEIASGTGQHIVHYARAFPGVTWQPTDIAPDRLASINAWVKEEGVDNVRPAINLNAGRPGWGLGRFEITLVSNLFHLVNNETARNILKGAAEALNPGGHFFVYGPFREAGAFRSEGDARFHAAITREAPDAGYKSVEWMNQAAAMAGLAQAARIEMPANNLALVWRRKHGS